MYPPYNSLCPPSTSDFVVSRAFYEQLQAIQKKLPKSDTAIMMGDVNASVGSDTLLGDVMGYDSLNGDRNESGEQFVRA